MPGRQRPGFELEEDLPFCALVELEGGRSAQTVGCPVVTSGRLGSILVRPGFLSPVTKVPSGPSIPLTRKTKQNPPAEAPEAGRASTSPHVGVSVPWSLCVLSPPCCTFSHVEVGNKGYLLFLTQGPAPWPVRGSG